MFLSILLYKPIPLVFYSTLVMCFSFLLCVDFVIVFVCWLLNGNDSSAEMVSISEAVGNTGMGYKGFRWIWYARASCYFQCIIALLHKWYFYPEPLENILVLWGTLSGSSHRYMLNVEMRCIRAGLKAITKCSWVCITQVLNSLELSKDSFVIGIWLCWREVPMWFWCLVHAIR